MFKKLKLIILSLLVAGAAVAETDNREKFGSDDQNSVYYLEKDTMTRKGYVVYAWQQIDKEREDENGVKFVRSQIEFDCNYKKLRTMWISTLAVKEGEKVIISSGMVNNPEWRPAVPDSMARQMLDFACVHVFRPRSN